MTTFSNETKRAVFEAQNGISKEGLEPITDFHHKLPNTKANRRRFPLFIHSPFNCVGLSRGTHTNKSHLYRVTIKEAEMYEKFLEEMEKRPLLEKLP